jgi:PD-(D/E)XK nuclease superfamily protein
MEHPKRIGDRSTLAIMLALQDAGFELLLPFGENTRYDLVIELSSRLVKVQCKTGRLKNGAVSFSPCSTYGHHRRAAEARRVYTDQVDFFGVYCPETGGAYLVPIGHVAAKTRAALRVTPSRNGQKRGLRFAADYLVGHVVVERNVSATEEPGARPGAGRSSA